MSVDVSVPSLSALMLAGSGVVSVTGMDVPDLTVTLSGSGVLRASGSATQLDVTVTGSGDAQLEELIAQDVLAAVIGSGRIVVTATESLDASVPGTGAIVYRGNPLHVTESVTGNGAITRSSRSGAATARESEHLPAGRRRALQRRRPRHRGRPKRGTNRSR